MEERISYYELLIKQLRCMVADETDTVALMANASALLSEAFHWHWIGFYRVVGNQLVLGPFQGPTACTRIDYGKGVCGTAWQQGKSLLVPDVALFPGHIACSALTRSEIVVPVFDTQGNVQAILDIDSTALGAFDETDRRYLEQFAAVLSK